MGVLYTYTYTYIPKYDGWVGGGAREQAGYYGNSYIYPIYIYKIYMITFVVDCANVS